METVQEVHSAVQEVVQAAREETAEEVVSGVDLGSGVEVEMLEEPQGWVETAAETVVGKSIQQDPVVKRSPPHRSE